MVNQPVATHGLGIFWCGLYFVNNLPLILFFVFLIVGKILQIWSEYTIHIHLNSI